jgi:ubiquitin carboxyl-terminal hydrolase 7
VSTAIFHGLTPSNFLRIRVTDCEQQQLYASVPQFYDFLQNRVLVSFRPKFEEPSATNPEFELMLSKKMTYELVSESP